MQGMHNYMMPMAQSPISQSINDYKRTLSMAGMQLMQPQGGQPLQMAGNLPPQVAMAQINPAMQMQQQPMGGNPMNPMNPMGGMNGYL